MKRWTKVLWSLLVVILLALGIGYGTVKSKIHQPSAAATTALKTATKTTSKYTFFKGDGRRKQPAVIFYPGALVSPASYSVWALQLAQHGISVYVMHFPLDLAVLAGNQASVVPKQVRQNYVIGGHSLGGVMASRYAAQHRTTGLKGVFYLASYPDEKGQLKTSGLPVLSVTASRDGVLNWHRYRDSRRYLPTNTRYLTIKGGNHGGFGSYGQQKGDHQATISNASQQRQISAALISWLNASQ